MNKLFELRPWLTIPEAAAYLSHAISQTVLETDLLRLGLDGSLQLSAIFSTYVKAWRGEVYRIGQHENEVAIRAIEDRKENPMGWLRLSTEHVLRITSEKLVAVAQADLPMLGNEFLHVDQIYRAKMGLPPSRVIGADGAFLLIDGSKEMFAIQDGSPESRVVQLPQLPYMPDGYSAATGLPRDTILVVRRQVITEFVRLMQATETLSSQRLESEADSTIPTIDPADLPDELSTANIAFRAVTNGYGDTSDTFKNRLIAYLKKQGQLTPEAVKRIAVVANPDKAPGRKRRTPK